MMDANNIPSLDPGRAMAIEVFDSVTSVTGKNTGQVIVAASHGGIYPGYIAAMAKVRGIVFSDAGVGRDRAGIGSLAFLDKVSIPAAVTAHTSARIGDGADMMRRGCISYVNKVASQLGCMPGQTCREAAELMRNACPQECEAPAYKETRTLLRGGSVTVWGLDSVSLVEPSDAGCIIVSGSHGGLLGGRAETAIKVDALGVVYHDAGIGIDRAGASRLPALDRRGIAAATVAADSARIGDALSIWSTGTISVLNDTAKEAGCRVGMTVPEFADFVTKRFGEKRIQANGAASPTTS
jgi:hypothetical protein